MGAYSRSYNQFLAAELSLRRKKFIFSSWRRINNDFVAKSKFHSNNLSKYQSAFMHSTGTQDIGIGLNTWIAKFINTTATCLYKE